MLYEGTKYFAFSISYESNGNGVASLTSVKVPSSTAVDFVLNAVPVFEKMATASCLSISSVLDFKPASGDLLRGVWTRAPEIPGLRSR